MANDLTDLTQAVHDETDAAAAAVVLINGFAARLDAAGVDPAKLADLSASLKASASALSAAVVANTPAAVPPPVA